MTCTMFGTLKQDAQFVNCPAMSLTTISTLDALTDALRSRIVKGDFISGQHLVEKALADEYSVARHTLRVALQALEAEGLITRAPNRGVFVSSLSPDEVVDIFRVRVALELEAIHLVVCAQEPLDSLDAALLELEGLAEDTPWTTVINHDLAFHRALIQAAQSPRLVRSYSAVEAEVRLTMIRQRPLYPTIAASAKEHRGVYESIVAGNEQRARERLRAHIEGSGRHLAAYLEESAHKQTS